MPSNIKNKTRIFHGLSNIAGIPGIIAKHEREKGFVSKSVCFPQGVYQREVDEIITGFSEKMISDNIGEYDIFNFHFGASLLGQSLDDLPLLKMMGKKIIMHFHGCDIRDSKVVQRKYEVSSCHVCFPMACNVNRKNAKAMSEKYADKILVYTPDLIEFVENSVWIPQPINLKALQDELKTAKKIKRNSQKSFRIVHAPSASEVKGSKYIQAAIATLINEGCDIEYVELTLRTHQEVIAEFAISDLVIDQLLTGAYGVVTMEAMALGVPSMCFLRDDVVPYYPDDIPVINANIFNILDKIRDAYNNRETLKQSSSKFTNYMNKYHSIEAVSNRLVEIYEEIS